MGLNTMFAVLGTLTQHLEGSALCLAESDPLFNPDTSDVCGLSSRVRQSKLSLVIIMCSAQYLFKLSNLKVNILLHRV